MLGRKLSKGFSKFQKSGYIHPADPLDDPDEIGKATSNLLFQTYYAAVAPRLQTVTK